MKLELFVKLFLGSLVINYTYSSEIDIIVRRFDDKETDDGNIKVQGNDLNELSKAVKTFFEDKKRTKAKFLYARLKKNGKKSYSYDMKNDFKDGVECTYIVFGEKSNVNYAFKYYDFGDDNYKSIVSTDDAKKLTKDEIINTIKNDIKKINKYLDNKLCCFKKKDLEIICSNFVDLEIFHPLNSQFSFVYKGELKNMDFINQLSVDDLKNGDYGFCIKPKEKQIEKEKGKEKKKEGRDGKDGKEGEKKDETSNNNGPCCCCF